MSEKCPKCGAEAFYIGAIGQDYKCGTSFIDGVCQYVGRKCLERQLATVTAERDALAGKLALSESAYVLEHTGKISVFWNPEGFWGSCVGADDLLGPYGLSIEAARAAAGVYQTKIKG